MLKENNQQASILNHDFKEHIGALSSLIGADNETAQEYIKSICGKFSQPKFIEYSDNKILNVVNNTASVVRRLNMKKLKKLNREQKQFLTNEGLNAREFLVERVTPESYVFYNINTKVLWNFRR